jgi:hypothetical protein
MRRRPVVSCVRIPSRVSMNRAGGIRTGLTLTLNAWNMSKSNRTVTGSPGLNAMPKIHGPEIPFPREGNAVGMDREYKPISCLGENEIGETCGGKIFRRVNVVTVWKHLFANPPDCKPAFAEQLECVLCSTMVPPESFR